MIKSKQQASYNNKNHCKEISNTNKNYCRQTINVSDYQYSIYEEFNNYKYYIAEASEKYFITQNKGHDKLFKEALKNKTDFIEFIKHFISIELANELTENNIEIYDRKFITNDFLEIESDIIYKVKNKSVYFIIEHQSTIDKNMAYRMFEYMTEIIKEHIQDKSIKSKSYPKIIPIVINTNNRKWNVATKYSDNEEKIEGITESYIEAKYILVDINNYTNEELYEKNTMLSYLMLLEKSKAKEEYEEAINKMINALKQEDTGKMARFVKYILGQVLEEEKIEEIIEELSKKGGKSSMPSALERFMLQERQEGRQEGKQEGKEEGRKQTLIEIIKNMLKKKMTISAISELTGLSEEEIKELQTNE